MKTTKNSNDAPAKTAKTAKSTTKPAKTMTKPTKTTRKPAKTMTKPAKTTKKPAKMTAKSKKGVKSPPIPAVHAYIRVSTEKQNLENQRFTLSEYAAKAGIRINNWVAETASGLKKAGERKLGALLRKVREGDTILVSEISRLGRDIFEIIGILRVCVERGCRIVTAKEDFRLGGDLSSLMLVFAFSLVAQTERQLISERTKTALARRRAEGATLGRRKGFAPAMTKLRMNGAAVDAMITTGAKRREIAARFGVSLGTLRGYERGIADYTDNHA